jgi:hypothetical protein
LIKVLLTVAPLLIIKIDAEIQSPGFINDGVLFGWGLLLLCSFLDRQRFIHLPLCLLIMATSFIVMPLILRSIHNLDPVNVAVGHASFVGISTRAGQVATLVATITACLLAVGAKVLLPTLRRINSLKRYVMEETPVVDYQERTVVTRFRRFGIPVMITAFMALSNIQDMRELTQYMRLASFAPQWDANNVTYWSYLVNTGYLPYRDFWYPYSGFYTFYTPLPWGFLIQWCYRTIIYSVLFYSLYKISVRRFWVSCFASLVIMAGDWMGIFQNGYRYLLAVDVFLSYLAIDRSCKRFAPSLAVFWVICGVAFFFEPMQLVYAAGAIALKLVLDFWQLRQMSWRVWLERAGREFGVPLALVITILCYFAAKGQLPGLAQLYLRAGDIAAYGAFPTDISWLKHPLREAVLPRLAEYSSLILFGPPILMGLGLFERLCEPGISNHYADALLGLGIIYLIVLQKHLVRPMEQHLLLYLVLTMFAYAVVRRGRSPSLDYAMSGVIAGMIAWIFFSNGAAATLVKSVETAPHRVVDNFRIMAFERGLLEKANSSYFESSHFGRFSEEEAVVARIRALDAGEITPDVFVLTDDPIVYILTGQRPPVFYATLYNASPIYDQERIVRWMHAVKPAFVVFDPSLLDSDQFQEVVRTPLVFNCVIRNYVPQETVGRFQVLRRRQGDEPIAIAYWREKLGSATNFGHLGQLSSFARLASCHSGSRAGCVPVLEIRIWVPHIQRASLAIPLEIAGLSFSLTLGTDPAKDEYYVPLERFWPWQAAESGELSRRVVEDKLPEGVTIRVIGRTASKEILY